MNMVRQQFIFRRFSYSIYMNFLKNYFKNVVKNFFLK